MSNDSVTVFFHEIVEPTVAEFLTSPNDKRRGCLAAFALSAMADHFYQARPDTAESLARFKSDIRGLNGAVGLVADVSNTTQACACKRITTCL